MSGQMSPMHRSSKRAFSVASSPRNVGPREKRARRCTASTSPASSPPRLLSKSFDALFAVPMSSPLTTSFTNLAFSTSSMPILPSSSSSFFPAGSSPISHNNSQMQPSLPPSSRHSRAMLDVLHREAFTNLRQSLAYSGESFLRRMRDWEEHRNMDNNNAPTLGDQERQRDRYRVRKRRISRMGNHTTGGISESHLRANISSAHVRYPDREPSSLSGYATFLSTQDDSDSEDDMLIDTVDHSLSPSSSERKACSESMRRPLIDTPDFREPFAIDLAGPDTENCPSAHYTSTFDFPFTYSNTRSSSPFSFGNTSDDESSCGSRYDQAHSELSSPLTMSMSSLADWSSHNIPTRNHSGMLGEGVPSSPSASPRSGFSHHLFTQHHMTVKSIDDTSTHIHPRLAPLSETNNQVPETPSDKALAALVLSLANGSGSLADYSYVREAQGELEELEAGGLWE